MAVNQSQLNGFPTRRSSDLGNPEDPAVLLKYGAKWAPAIYKGQWWRFFTAPFLHFGLLHLGMNLYALYIVGTQVEYVFGKANCLLIYLFAALWSVLASLYFCPESISAGASGAIFGLVGALLCFALFHRRYLRPGALLNLIVVIGINLALGLLMSGIDNFAHLGGVIAGFAVAFLLTFKTKKRMFAVIGFAFLTAILIVNAAFPPSGSWRQLSAAGSEALEGQRYPEAVALLEKAREKAPADAERYFRPLVAQAHFHAGNKVLKQDPKLAARHYTQAISCQADPAAYHNLVLAYWASGDEKKAKETLGLALKLYPETDFLLDLQAKF